MMIRVVNLATARRVVGIIARGNETFPLICFSLVITGIRVYVPCGKTSPIWAPIAGFRSGTPL
jgi:hypothetical protein